MHFCRPSTDRSQQRGSASMKILHIAPDRDAALVAARVVHGIAQNVTLTWVQTPAAALAVAARQPRHRGCHRRGAGAELRLVRRAASRTRSDDAGRGRRGIRATRTGARRAQFWRRRIRGGRSVARGRPASNRGRGHRTRAQPPATPHAELRARPTRTAAARAKSAPHRLADVQARHSVSLARETKICTGAAAETLRARECAPEG